MTEKTAIDWQGIEIEFRAGVKSLEQIGREFGVTKGRISQIAKRDKWNRDLSIRIKAKADARVNEAAVNKRINAKSVRLAESVVVASNVDLQVSVRLAHRTDIQRVKSLLLMLLAEAEHQGANVALYQDLGEILANPDDKGQDKLGEIYRKAMSLPSRVGVLKQITETLALLIKLEREAFGIDSAQTVNGLEAKFLDVIKSSSANG